MLQRVLEPEVMDSVEEAVAYDGMDHEAVNRLFVDDLVSYLESDRIEGPVLDIGTGTARIPIALCHRSPAATVVGIDLSENMLLLGRKNVAAAHFDSRITLDNIDAKKLPYADGTFSTVISNSIVHHVARPEEILAEAVRVTKADGVLFFRDLLRPPDDAAVKRLVHQYAGGDDKIQQKLFDDSLRAALSLAEIRSLVGDMGLDPTTVRTTSDRHWTLAAETCIAKHCQAKATRQTMEEAQPPDQPQDEFSSAADVTDPAAVGSDSEADASGEMTPEQLAEAKQYGRAELICEITGRVIDFAFLCVVAFVLGGPGGWLMQIIPGADYAETLRLAALMFVLIIGNMIVSFPVAYFSGHVLEHRYNLSRQTLGQWLWRFAKRHLLEIAFTLVLVPGLYWLIWLTGGWWWLVAAVGFFLLSVVLGQLAPVLILPLFYKIEPLEDDEESAELNDRMKRLTAGTGLSIEGVFRMEMSAETTKANAMLTGLGRTRRVILGDTVLKNFTPDEIEVIFAHEIGHHVCRHIRKMMVTGAIYSMFGFLVCDWVLQLWIGHHGGTVDYAAFPIYTLPMMMLVITLFSTVLEPLQNGISRHFERQSDQYALDRTGLREAYRSAFRKLARLNKDDPEPNPIEVFLFHSHPPIAERLAMAD